MSGGLCSCAREEASGRHRFVLKPARRTLGVRLPAGEGFAVALEDQVVGLDDTLCRVADHVETLRFAIVDDLVGHDRVRGHAGLHAVAEEHAARFAGRVVTGNADHGRRVRIEHDVAEERGRVSIDKVEMVVVGHKPAFVGLTVATETSEGIFHGMGTS